MSHVRLRIGIGRVENRLRIIASRSKIGKLRDGGQTHRRRGDFRLDPTAPSLKIRTRRYRQVRTRSEEPMPSGSTREAQLIFPFSDIH